MMLRRRVISSLVLLAAIVFGGDPVASGEDSAEKVRATLLEQMGSLAAATHVDFVEAKGDIKLLEKPVFRYDDRQRDFIDATVWAWLDGGRPVAFQKVEAIIDWQSKPKWTHCFSSLSEDLLSVKWESGQTYRSTEPGVAFRPIPEAPAVAERASDRKRQMRALVRDFSARIVLTPAGDQTEQMRLLTTPLFDYSDPETKLPIGSVFGLSTAGTNPDILLVLEARPSAGALQWHYSPVRMTAGGIVLKHRDSTVWEVEFVLQRQSPFPNWTFFQIPRTPVQEKPEP